MENIGVLKEERKLLKSLSIQLSDVKLPQITAFILCFIFSRANFFGVLRPFSTALYVSLGLSGISKLVAILVITVANAYFTNLYDTVTQLSALLLFELLSYMLFLTSAHIIDTKKETIYSKALLMSGIIGVIGIVRGMVYGIRLYDLVVSLLGALMVFSISIALSPASMGFSQKRSIGIIFDNKIRLAKLILLSILIISLDGLVIWNCHLGTILAGLAVIIIAVREGPAMGAMVGAVLGMIIALMDFPGSLDVPGMFALSGAAAGILTKRRRTSSILWLIAVIIFSGLTVLEGVLTVKYYEALVAGIIFFILPNTVINFLGDELVGIKKVRDPELYETGKAHEAADKLFVLGKALSKVSRSIEENIVEGEEDNNSVVQWIIEAVAEKVCGRCSMCDRCWSTYLIKTYKMVEESLTELKINEDGQPEIPQWFGSVCKRSESFFEALTMAHSIYKADKVWRQRLKESRMLLSQQAVVVSAGIMSLARNLNNLSDRDMDTEYRLICASEGRGIPVSRFRYHKGKVSKPCLEVLFEAKNRINPVDLDDIVQENLQNDLIRIGECRRDLMGYSVVKYMKKPRFKTITGIARASKDEETISGDTFAFFISSSGYHINAISDGTGSGKRAEKYSRTAIQILETLIDDGIDINLAVRFINLYLNMKGNDDRLATIDISAIDLYSGEVSFYKYDAPPAIIKKKNETIVIEAGEVNDEHNANAMRGNHFKPANLSAGNFLIIMSDGILEAFSSSGEIHALRLFIDKLDIINPQLMADAILDEAITKAYGKHDDMTVLVTKLW